MGTTWCGSASIAWGHVVVPKRVPECITVAPKEVPFLSNMMQASALADTQLTDAPNAESHISVLSPKEMEPAEVRRPHKLAIMLAPMACEHESNGQRALCICLLRGWRCPWAHLLSDWSMVMHTYEAAP